MTNPLRRLLSVFNIGPLFFLASLLIPLGVALYLIVFAEPPVPITSAVLSTVNNVVEVQGINDTGFARAQEEQVLVAGDDVRTLDQGRGVITFADLSNLVLDPDSQLTILAPQRKGGGLVNRFNQSFGTSWSQFSSLAKGGGRYEIQTPAGVVAVRDGAILRVGVGQSASGKATVQVVVLQGEAEIKESGASGSAAGKVIGAGQTLTATEGEALPDAVAFVPDNDVVVRLFSPFWMLVSEPGSGLSTGLIPPGIDFSQIPLSLTTAEGSSPQSIRLNDLVAGTYTIYLIPKRDGGDFRVTANGAARGEAKFSDARSGTTGGCEWFFLLLHVDLDDDGLLSFGELQGPFPLGALPPVVGRSVEAPCPDPKPLTARVEGVQATATPQPTPVPTQSPTAVPEVPTEVPPTVEPTKAPTATLTVIAIEIPEATDVPPTSVPPQPTARPHPDIAIDHTEEGMAGPGSPALPLALGMAPAVFLGVLGFIRRKGGGR